MNRLLSAALHVCPNQGSVRKACYSQSAFNSLPLKGRGLGWGLYRCLVAQLEVSTRHSLFSAVSPSEKCRFSCREVPFLLQRSATSLGVPTLGKTLSHHGKLKKVRHLIILTPPQPLPYKGREQLPPISPQVLPSHVGEGQGWG